MKIFITILFSICVLTSNAQQLTGAEYFFDVDPGIGNGTAFSFTPADTISQDFTFPTTGLSEGMHTLWIRFKDGNQWSNYRGQNFYLNNYTTYTLTEAEYFYDTDPGVGNGVSFSFIPADTINQDFAFPTTGLSEGLHTLWIRFKEGNHWGLYRGQSFYVNNYTSPQLTSAEYFFDTDPGVGNGTLFITMNSDTVELDTSIPFTGLDFGTHYLYIRVRDELGKWSIAHRDTFEIIDAPIPTILVVQNATIISNQAECFNATNTITLGGSGTTMDVLSGSEATFIAGEKIIFEPGFSAHNGSYCSAYITTTGDYCSQPSPMMAQTPTKMEESLIADAKEMVFEEVDLQREINIYPNPTTGVFTIDFLGNETTAEIIIMNFQGNQFCNTTCNKQVKKEIEIEYLPSGVYVIVIKTELQVATRKLIKLNL